MLGISAIQSQIQSGAAQQAAMDQWGQKIQALGGRVSGAGKPADQDLLEACQAFESYFLEYMMKQMWKSIPKAEQDGGYAGLMEEYAREEMIKDLAAQSTKNNSLGLANMLYEQMKRNYM